MQEIEGGNLNELLTVDGNVESAAGWIYSHDSSNLIDLGGWPNENVQVLKVKRNRSFPLVELEENHLCARLQDSCICVFHYWVVYKL